MFSPKYRRKIIYNQLRADIQQYTERWNKKVLQVLIRSVYKELHADHETGAADNK